MYLTKCNAGFPCFVLHWAKYYIQSEFWTILIRSKFKTTNATMKPSCWQLFFIVDMVCSGCEGLITGKYYISFYVLAGFLVKLTQIYLCLILLISVEMIRVQWLLWIQCTERVKSVRSNLLIKSSSHWKCILYVPWQEIRKTQKFYSTHIKNLCTSIITSRTKLGDVALEFSFNST